MSKRFSPLQRMVFAFVGTLGYLIIRVYFLTVRHVHDDRSRHALHRSERLRGIYPMWHAHQLAALVHNANTRGGLLISQSKDGEYLARLAQRAGFATARGSSSRGGANALMKMIRLAEDGHPLSLTPDGPKGPRYTIHRGVITLAQKSGLPIIPAAMGLSDFWEIPSWDRFRIPKPFSVCYGCWGEPITVPADADADACTAIADKLRASMIALEEHADRSARAIKRHRGPVDLPPSP